MKIRKREQIICQVYSEIGNRLDDRLFGPVRDSLIGPVVFQLRDLLWFDARYRDLWGLVREGLRISA